MGLLQKLALKVPTVSFSSTVAAPTEGQLLYHRERILETSTLSCNEEEEDITKPPKR